MIKAPSSAVLRWALLCCAPLCFTWLKRSSRSAAFGYREKYTLQWPVTQGDCAE